MLHGRPLWLRPLIRAVTEFFKKELAAGRENRLKYRSIHFWTGGHKIGVELKKSFARVHQGRWVSFCPQQKISPPSRKPSILNCKMSNGVMQILRNRCLHEALSAALRRE